MRFLEKLKNRWANIDYPFLIHPDGEIRFNEVSDQTTVDLSIIKNGDVVALIGDFDPKSILTLIQLLDKNIILVPLTKDTKPQHEYFFNTAMVDVVIENSSIKRLKHNQKNNLLEQLREKKHSGLVPVENRTKPECFLSLRAIKRKKTFRLSSVFNRNYRES